MSRNEIPSGVLVKTKGRKVIVSGSRTSFSVDAPRNGVHPKDVPGIDQEIRAKTNRVSDVQLVNMGYDISDVLTYLMDNNTRKVKRGIMVDVAIALGILGGMTYSAMHVDLERPLLSIVSVVGEGLAGILYTGIAARRSQSLSSGTEQLVELAESVTNRLNGRLKRPITPRTTPTAAKYN